MTGCWRNIFPTPTSTGDAFHELLEKKFTGPYPAGSLGGIPLLLGASAVAERQSHGKLSHTQWWPCEFTAEGLRYVCAEQFKMAAKARCFHDEFTQHRILAENDPAAIKKLGRQVRNFGSSALCEKLAVA